MSNNYKNLKNNKTIKVGITVNFGIKIFSNGLQQNIIFLKKLFDNIQNFEPIFIYTGKIPEEDYISKEQCINYTDFIKEQHKYFDLVILVGFWLEQNYIKDIKKSNKKIKLVTLQCGNQFVENSMRSIHNYEKVEYFNQAFEGIDAVWILPQHAQNISYMKTHYRTDSISIVPYIWDSAIIDSQIKELSKNEERDILFTNKLTDVVILEPNLSLIKNCILPIYIVEAFERKFKNKLSSLNILGGLSLVDNHYFMRLIMQLDIFKERKDFLKVHNRFKFIDAIRLFGSLVISHQLENDLNYLYFDALYLNLPLIHNSNTLKKYGYFYPHNDIDVAIIKIKDILESHNKNIINYKKRNKEMFEIYSIENKNNQKLYIELINNVLS